MRSSLWVLVILDQRSAVTVQSGCTVNLLSNCDFIGHCVCTVGARVTDCNIWISASLGLAYLKGPWIRSFYGKESVKWSYQSSRATSLLDSTRCNWAKGSLGISNYLRTCVNSGGGGRGIVVKNLGCNGCSSKSVTIKCLCHFPVVMSNYGTTGILAADTYCVFITGIHIL